MAEDFNLDYVTEMGSAFFQMTPQAGLSGYIGGRLMIREEETFIDVTEGSGLETITNVHCPLFFDLDGDIDDDLFVAGNHTAQVGRLFRNNGDSTFVDISDNTNEGGFPLCQGAAIGDIDNDGDFDLYLTFATGYNSMWENDGTGFFTNITELSHTGVAGFTRGVCFGDFDHDTDLDLFLNRAQDYNVLFLNNGHGVFTDISEEAGVVDNLNGIGCATGDLDNDGQLDIVAVNCDFQRNLVYINENEDTSFLKIRMVGTPKNSLALGSIIDLFGVSEDDLDTVRIGKREVQSHTGMFSVNDPIAHFGTGEFQNLIVKATFQSLDEVTLYDIWPGQTISIYERPTDIADSDPSLPDRMTLATYPNPFNSAINIAVTGGTRPGYELAIYDMLGRLVNSDLIYETDNLNYTWDGLNNSGQPAPSGIYCLRVRNGEFAAEKKITLVK